MADRKSRLRIREVPEPAEVWLEVPSGAWTVSYRIEVERGRLVFSEMRLTPSAGRAPGPGIEAGVLRAIPVAAHRRLVLEHIDAIAAQFGDAAFGPRGVLGRHGLDTVRADAQSRGAARDELYFARIAARYVELLDGGIRQPTPILADELERPRSYVTGAIRDARKMGLLTATERGRAGGQLTRKAKALLGRAEKEAQQNG